MSIAYPSTALGPESITTEMLKAEAVTGAKIALGTITNNRVTAATLQANVISANTLTKGTMSNEKANLTLTGKITSVGEPIAMVRIGNLVILRGQFKIEAAIKAAEEFASIIEGYRPLVALSEIPIRSTIGTEKKLSISTAGVLTLSTETAAETYNLDVAYALL